VEGRGGGGGGGGGVWVGVCVGVGGVWVGGGGGALSGAAGSWGASGWWKESVNFQGKGTIGVKPGCFVMARLLSVRREF
jgi:hypothetical protein